MESLLSCRLLSSWGDEHANKVIFSDIRKGAVKEGHLRGERWMSQTHLGSKRLAGGCGSIHKQVLGMQT